MFECRKARKRLVDYLEGMLSGPAGAEVDRHVLSCRACQGELEGLQAAREVMLSTRPLKCPEGVWEQIERKIRSVQAEKSNVWNLLSRPAYAITAGLVLWAMMAISLMVSPSGSMPPAASVIVSPLSPVGISVEAGTR